MLGLIKKILYAPLYKDTEMKILIRFLKKIGNAEQLKILEVGSGAGRVLKGIQSAGFNATGVEVNESLVKKLKVEGLDCLTVGEFNSTQEKYDVIMMCHVIEHFAPQDLLKFIDGYLERLNHGGYLIVSTPIMTNYFYNDFDHVKPYTPIGLNMVFDPEVWDQVQYYSKNKLKLQDIWYRTGYFRITHARGKYIRSWQTYFLRLFEIFSVYLTFFSCGLIGQKDGWVGLYKKVGLPILTHK